MGYWNTLLVLGLFASSLDSTLVNRRDATNSTEATTTEKNSTNSTRQYSNFQFSVDLLRNLAQKNSSVTLSPFGISLALGVLSLAAQGNSLTEIFKTLGFKDEDDFAAVHLEFKELIQSMKESEGNSLDFATCIFTQSGCGIMSSFGKKAIEYFNSDIQQLDFSKTDLASYSINNWAAKNTNNKIESLVKPDSLNPSTQLMIVSTVYFHGLWQIPFNVSLTSNKTFTLITNETTTVQMMRVSGEFQQAYDSETNTRILALPYANSNLSMVILLPRNVDGLPKLVETLTPEVLKRMFASLTYSQLFVDMPKFKLDSDLSIKSALTQMGMKDLFTSKANITGVLCNQTLLVNEMIHKTFVEVDELGTTAASATGIELIPWSKPFSFTVDHPFMFFILDHESELILFSGAVYDLP